MAQHNFVSIDRVFAKLYRDLPIENISESDVIEWVGEALQAIGTVSLYEEAIAFMEVRNYQADLPQGFHKIIQIAKNNIDKIGSDTFCPANIIAEITPEDQGPDVPVAINCQGEPVNAYDVAYYRPYFDLKYEYLGWAQGNYYRTKYSPVTLSNNILFNSLVCYHKDKDNYANTGYSYNIIQGRTLRFSFMEGLIAVSYLRNVTDPETGYPLVPDSYSHLTAITKYITMKLMEREFYSNREGSTSKLQKAESDWQWYVKQAGNSDMMIQGIDEHQNFLNQRSYLIPNNNSYDTFFGFLTNREDRSYLDSTNRLNY